MEILLNYQLKNEVSQANLNNYTIIYNYEKGLYRYLLKGLSVWLILKARKSSLLDSRVLSEEVHAAHRKCHLFSYLKEGIEIKRKITCVHCTA